MVAIHSLIKYSLAEAGFGDLKIEVDPERLRLTEEEEIALHDEMGVYINRNRIARGEGTLFSRLQ